MEIYKLNIDEYKLKEVNHNVLEKVYYYNTEDIPKKYVDIEPDWKKVNKAIINFLDTNFSDKQIAIRVLSTKGHNHRCKTNRTRDDIVDIIEKNGHDRDNKNIKGDRYDNIENRRIDFFAIKYENEDENLCYMFPSQYFFGIKENGFPTIVDIMIIYDETKLIRVEHTYEGRNESKDDGCVFKDESNKIDAILGIVLIN